MSSVEKILSIGGCLDEDCVQRFSRVCKFLYVTDGDCAPAFDDCRTRRRPRIRISVPRTMMTSNPLMAS